ncbi:MAG: HAMP domain-containing histidine kinase [Mycobacterium sp.]|nr:HAMP domain-containing histidine kinase [Mycobacterium sp.]
MLAVVDLRAQSRQTADHLTHVAEFADDAHDPPPGMELVMRHTDGQVSTSQHGGVGLPLLAGPAGFTEISSGERTYRALVMDRPTDRVVAMIDMAPIRADQARLWVALGFAALVGILGAAAVVVFVASRSVRPLTQALARQRRFVADASHELRAPLTVLHTRAQLLAQRLDSENLTAAARDAGALVADTRVLADIVDGLLASASLTEAGSQKTRVDLSAVAHSVCDRMTDYAESIGVVISCEGNADHRPGSLEVLGSEVSLERVLTALVDNALSHEKDGGTVDLRVRRDGQQVIAEVADDGAGIDKAVLPHLFDRFSRGEGHTTRQGRPSYGIGLSLVREIVQAHGGDIRVASTLGQGATFTVSLPAAPASVASSQPGRGRD